MKKYFLIVLWLFTSVVMAQQTADGGLPGQRFRVSDANHDGQLSKDEAQKMPRLEGKFEQIDADKSGAVSQQELLQFKKHQHEEHFKTADVDNNGQISKQEAEKNMPRAYQDFDEIDTNHDGQASHEELKMHHLSKMQQKRMAK